MSCDAAALALSLHFAAFEPTLGGAPRLMPISTASAPMSPLVKEPMFADIVKQASALERQVDAWRTAPPAAPSPAFEAKLAQLSTADMAGHVELAKRGTDGDLKCILRGISQDLPKKLAALKDAPGLPERKTAAAELYFLLRDNVEVVTTPAKVTSTDVASAS